MTDMENISTEATTAPEGNNGTELVSYEIMQKQIQSNLILSIMAVIICLIGLIGNGIVFWFLFFKINQNHCTVYILNLAIADFTFLVGCCITLVPFICILSGVHVSDRDGQITMIIGEVFYGIGFNTSSFALTAISMERCIAVLFPVWYRCKRMKNQSIIVCVILWALSCLVMVLENFVCDTALTYPAPGSEKCTGVFLFTSALYLLVILLMVSSSLTLIIDIRKSSKQCRPLRLYIVIVVTILIFLLSVVPGRVLGLVLYFGVLPSEVFLVQSVEITSICTAIYCSSNPYVYICVGMWKKQWFRGAIKDALEKVFKEEIESSLQREEINIANHP